MPGPIRLGVIGAGSAEFSAGLVKDICLTPGLAGSRVVLMDVDAGRAETMHRFAQRYAAELGSDVSFHWTTAREEALAGADFVVNTAQVGGHAQVEGLRAWCEEQGYYRGFRLAHLIQIRFMLSVARDMERLCPEAWLIQASNPVFEGCTAMSRATRIKVCGLCHGHFGYRHIAEVLGLEQDQVEAVCVGFNHEVWMTRFTYEGRDAYPLLDEWIETKSAEHWRDYDPGLEAQMSPAAIELYKLTGLMPIGDTPRSGGWWFHQDLETKRRWYGGTGGFDSEIGWGQYLQGCADRVTRIQAAVEDSSGKLTEVFPAERTYEQHLPLIDALWNDHAVRLQVNVPNRGAIPSLPDDMVVELPARCSQRGIEPLPVDPLPEVLLRTQLDPRRCAAEQAVSLALHPDERLLLRLVLDDHRTQSWEQAVRFVREIEARPEFAEFTAALTRPRHPFRGA